MKKSILSLSVIITFVIYVVATLSKGNVIASPNVIDKNNSVVQQSPDSSKTYKDGQYTGKSVDVYYGNVQVQATVQNGKISDVTFLDHPKDRGTSVAIYEYASPRLKSEAIAAQSAQIDTVSGATATSGGFIQSLADALSQAQS